MRQLGIGFSGGGSRAAAFHRGTLRGLFDVGIMNQPLIDNNGVVVSTVSGGSIFGAAWLASIFRKQGVTEFLEEIGRELAKGFVLRTIRPRLLKTMLPGYTRTHALAKTFDNIFFKGMKLKELPTSPCLCINTAVLNNGQVGKFSREGFSVPGIRSKKTADIPLSLAVAASAAFPIGLPPVYLKRGKHLPKEKAINPGIGQHKRIALTDGGVLENLGVQTLLMGTRFSAWDIVTSDAGKELDSWQPGRLIDRLWGFLMGLFSAPSLKRVTLVMNDKQNRHMRRQLYAEMERTWLIDGLKDPAVASGTSMQYYLGDKPAPPRRKIFFIRLNKTWDDFFEDIPDWRLVELAEEYRARTGLLSPPIPCRAASHGLGKAGKGDRSRRIIDYLRQVLDNKQKHYLEKAGDIYSRLGGDERLSGIKDIPTGFCRLAEENLTALHDHAYWQVLASYSVFW